MLNRLSDWLPDRRSHAILLFALAVGTTGCAAKSALHTESSTAAIRSAEELGAPGVPQAALHLQLAKEELQAATDLQEAGDKDEAMSMLLRAEADAELAIALSQADAERNEATAAMQRVRTLQSENPYAPASPPTGGTE